MSLRATSLLNRSSQYNLLKHFQFTNAECRHFSLEAKTSKEVMQRTSKISAPYAFPQEIFPNVLVKTMEGVTPKINFTDTKEAYKSKSTFNLVRTLIILRICGIRVIVDNADMLMRVARKVFSDYLVIPVVKYTFFAHFCAGEDNHTIKPTIDFLHSYNIGPILDYAAESDIADDASISSAQGQNQTDAAAAASAPAPTNGRYNAHIEAMCESSVKTFIHCIHAVDEVTSDGFAAIKFTALIDPALLERVTTLLDMFLMAFPESPEGQESIKLDLEQFSVFVKDSFGVSTELAKDLFSKMDLDGDGFVNAFDWNQSLSVYEMLDVMKNPAPRLFPAHLQGMTIDMIYDDKDRAALDRLSDRLHRVVKAALPTTARVMVDAEHRYFQTCVDRFTLDLQRQYNNERTVVWGTYQCYLKSSPRRLQMELLRAKILGYKWAAKLVRGAYMEHERADAAKKGFPSPVFDDIESTHASYNWCLDHALRTTESTACLMVASHNQQTIEFAVQLMENLNIAPDAGNVYFGQLLGMADHLTFGLGQNKYGANKYVPFGKVEEVIPYLLRRARENSNMLGGVGKERKMLWNEFKRRCGF